MPGFDTRRLSGRFFLLLLAALTIVTSGDNTTPARAASGQPNILILLSDDQPEGMMNEMPFTSALFQTGTQFTNAYDTTPLCCPSRASIFSGKYLHNHTVTYNHGEYTDFNHEETWQYNLSQTGYRTAFFGKFFNRWPSQTAPFFSESRVGLTGNGYSPDEGTADFLVSELGQGFIERSEEQDDLPWAMELAFRSPHAPHVALPKYNDLKTTCPKTPAVLETDLSDKPQFIRDRAKPEHTQRTCSLQRRQLHALDDAIAQVWNKLEMSGEADNTLVFYISDNGVQNGAHNWAGKGMPYMESVHVPFYVRWPGHMEAGQSSDLVANIDIAPTIYQAAGVTPNYSPDGESLLGPRDRQWLLLESPRSTTQTISYPIWDAIVNAAHSREYIRWDDGFIESYNLTTDPWQLEASNAAKSRYDGILDQLRNCQGPTCQAF